MKIRRSWNNDAKIYILSVNIKRPIEIKTKPDIFEEYFWNAINILFLKLNFPDKTEMRINGIDKPNEKLINKPTPLYRVAEFEVKVNRAPNTGPIHGVKPKAKVKPKTKFLNVEYFFIST